MNTLNEFVEGFDLDTFYNMKSFSAKIKYANSKLKRIGSGSSRIVYAIDDKKVLKLAKNEKGIAQNEIEADYLLQDWYGDIIAKVFEKDDRYRWLISERCKKITQNEFKQYFGVDCEEFRKYLLYGVGKRDYSGLPQKTTIDKLNNNDFATELLNMFSDFDMTSVTNDYARIANYGKIDNKIVLSDYGLTYTVYKSHYK